MARQDIRLNKDFINANNDIEWYYSDVTHIERTIEATPNSYKENPSDGVAIVNYLNSNGQEDALKRKAIIQLQSDQYRCQNPIVTTDASGVLTLNPNIEL